MNMYRRNTYLYCGYYAAMSRESKDIGGRNELEKIKPYTLTTSVGKSIQCGGGQREGNEQLYDALKSNFIVQIGRCYLVLNQN